MMGFKISITLQQFQNIMSTDFDEISASIVQEQKRIQQNQQERNRNFNDCLEKYLTHLKQQTEKLEATEADNDARNQMISSAFENVYERIMTSSQVALRKVKDTCLQKREFWDKLIKNNAELTDMSLKKSFYEEKREAQFRYEQAFENQKAKKIPYQALLGKFKQKHNLKQWQANNRLLQNQVVKGTKTIQSWKQNEQGRRHNEFYGEASLDNDHILNQFTTQGQTQPWSRPVLRGPNQSSEDTNMLQNFHRRR